MAQTVFIGAAFRDDDLVMDLNRKFKKAGYKVITKEFLPNEAIDRRVRDSLSKSHEVFVLLTEHSLNNSWIVPTLGAAFGLHKPITAVLMGVREHEIPLMVQGMRRLKYADVDDYIAALQSRSERVFA